MILFAVFIQIQSTQEPSISVKMRSKSVDIWKNMVSYFQRDNGRLKRERKRKRKEKDS